MATTYRGEDRRRENVAWKGPERRSRFAPSSGGQLLEEGAAPSGPTGQVADNPNEFTSDGGEGTNTPNEWTALRNQSSIGTPGVDDRETREPDEADPETGGTGDEGGDARRRHLRRPGKRGGRPGLRRLDPAQHRHDFRGARA